MNYFVMLVSNVGYNQSASYSIWSQGFFSHSLSGRKIGLFKASDTFDVFQVLIKMADSHRDCQHH